MKSLYIIIIILFSLSIKGQSYQSTHSDGILEEVYQWEWGPCRYVKGYQDSLIFVTQGQLLQCIDISVPQNPTIIIEYNLGITGKIEIKDEFLFLNVDNNLHIYDIENVLNIKLLSIIPNNGYLIKITDSLLVTGDYDRKVVELYNITDLTNPEYYSTIYFPEPANGVELFDVYLYVSDSYYPSYYVYDISNPYQPNFLASHSTYNPQVGLYIFDTSLYVLDGGVQNLKIYDLDNPVYPQLINWISLDSLAGRYLVKQDSILFISNSYSVTSINIADILNPHITSSYWDNTNFNPSGDIEIINNYILHPFRHSFEILKILTDYSFLLIHEFYTAEEVNGFAHKDDYLFVACGSSGIWIFDISDPESPVQIKNFLGDKWIGDIKVYTNLLITYGSIRGYYESKLNFKIFDISDPLQPQLLSEIYNYKPYWPHKLWNADFEIQEDFLYIAHPDSGIFVIDIHDPSNPLPISLLYLPDSKQEVRDFSLYGDYLYLANRLNGLKILDISNPYNISILDSINNIVPYLVLAKDNYLYLAQFSSSIIYDITNPVNPSYISEVSIGGNRIEIVDEINRYWYLCKSTLTRLVNIEDKYNLTIVDTLSANVNILTAYLLYNKYLFINYGAFKIYKNKSVLSLPKQQFKSNLAIDIKYYPNPFNQTITFEILPASLEDVKLNIYNILGQLAWSKEFKLGNNNNKITWDATSRDGNSVGSGIYFIKIHLDKQPIYTGKIVYVK